MTTPKQNRKKVKAKRISGRAVSEPTVFDQLLAINSALREEMEIAPLEIAPKSKVKLPEWSRTIIKQLGKTILKPILKLRPNGTVDWRNYGKMVTIMERYKTFVTHDVPRILEAELGDVTDEQWKKIEPQFGLDKLRAHCIKILKRPVADEETLETLVDEASAQVLQNLESQKQTAFYHVAKQRPKHAALFYKGMAEGYDLFIDENANFCGDRGRSQVYLDLLSCMLEVEKIRQTLPPTTRSQYYDRLANTFKLPPKAYDWFNDVCDDIKFPLNKLGRKRRSSAALL